MTVTDVDERGTQALHLTITLDDPAKGVFTTNSLAVSGFANHGGAYEFSGSPAAATAAFRALVFDPADDRVPIGQSETTRFTITADDAHGGITVDPNTMVRVASVAGAPEITVPQPQPISRPQTPPILPFEAVTIADEEVLDVTVGLANTNLGAFTTNSLAAAGFTNSGGGALTFRGTAGAATAAIRMLEFGLNTNIPPATVTFYITAVDETGNSVSASLAMVFRLNPRVLIVTQTGDFEAGETDPARILGTLRKTVEDAGSNDHITFDLRSPTPGVPDLPAVLRLRRPLVLNKNVTIDGPGADLLAISGDQDADGTPDVQLFRVNAQAIFNRLTLTQGKGGYAGGAISVSPNGHLTLSYCAVTDSTAEQYGGGIDVDRGSLFLDHCLIKNNLTSLALGKGGGGVSIYSDQPCSIENTTFAANQQQSSAGFGGGALYVENAELSGALLVFVTGCTFRDNRDAAIGGTSIRPNVFNCLVELENTFLADGQGHNLDVDESGEILSLGGNISDDSTRTIFSWGGDPYEVTILDQPSDLTSATPGLTDLAANGGPTLTCALATDSPAIGLAVESGLATDQRGFWRDADPDTGAFELGTFKQIIINEINFDPPAPGTNDEFLEFIVPRYAETLDVAGLQVFIGGALRHTFTPRSLAPGQALILFSRDAVNTSVASTTNGPFVQIAAQNLQLDNLADTVTLKAPDGRVLFEVSYVGAFTVSDPAITNLLGAHQSITLVPEFAGVFLPHQRAYKKIVGGDPSPGSLSSPGKDVSGRSLAGGNAPPVAFDDYSMTDEDTAQEIPVLANDVELDRFDHLSVTSVTSTSTLGAAVAIHTSPRPGASVIYNPGGSPLLQSLAAGASLVDSFAYSIIDCCNPATGTNWPAVGTRYTATNYVTVTGVNDSPTPQPDNGITNPALRTTEDRELVINTASALLANDTDPDADDDSTTLQMSAVHSGSAPEATFQTFSQLGALVTLELRFNRDETRIFYDPRASAMLNTLSAGQITNDTFYYSVVDRHGAVGTAAVQVQVTGVNDQPTARPDAATTYEDTPVLIPVAYLLGGDLDPDTLTTLRIVALNGAGSLTATSALGATISIQGTNLLYNPTVSSNLNALTRKEVAVDTFTYTISDQNGGTSTALVSLTVVGVNDQPQAAPDANSVDEDTVLSVAAPGVLANDRDPDVNGLPPDDQPRVIPVSGQTTGGVPFTINADGGFSYDPRGVFDWLTVGAAATDTFLYTMVDGNLTLANDDAFAVLADSTNNLLAVLANDAALAGLGGQLRVTAVGPPDHGGAVSINADSTGLAYSPQVNFAGVETFQYTIEDSQGGYDTAIVRVTVIVPVLNGNLAANDDRFTVARGTSASLPVLLNDNVAPASGDTLTVVELGAPSRGGTVALTGTGPNNSIIYTPVPSISQSFPYLETFTYTLTGGGSARSTATVTVTVLDRNGSLPVNDDVFTILAGGGNNILDVIANDRVIPGTSTNLVIMGLQTNGISGTVSINPSRTRLLYAPPAGATRHVEPVFRYVLADGSGGTATGQVSVTVVPDGLNANADFFTAAWNSTNTLLVLANDNVLPNLGQSLFITTIGLGTNAPNQGGQVTIGASGKSLVYAPANGFTGEETFACEITDGTLARAQARVKVAVQNRTGAVNVNPDVFSVSRDSSNTVLRVLQNDNVQPDMRERLAIISLTVPGQGGLAAIAGSVPNQVVLYTPPRGFVGEETLAYSVSDGRGGTGTATLKVRVGGLAAQNDRFTVLAGSNGNALDVLANDRLLPNGTPSRPIFGVSPTDRGGSVQINGSGTALLYTPAAGFTGLESFSYQVSDDTGGLITGNVVVSVLPAGTDRDASEVTITIHGINDPPVIAGATGGLQITDKQTVQPFSGVAITDVDEYGRQPLTVTVSLDDAAKGVFVNLGGFVKSAPGVYTFSGIGAAASAAIQALVFDPAENRIPVPNTEITVFTIGVDDGYISSPVTNRATTVAVTAVNDPPVIAGTVAGLTVYHYAPLRLFAGVTVTEVDDLTLQPLRVTVTVSDPTHGYLTSLNGFTNAGDGVYTLGATAEVTAANATLALNNLLFVPTASNRVVSGTSELTGFSIQVEDAFAGPVTDSQTTAIALHEFVAKLVASDGADGDGLGAAVAATRDVVVIGAPQDDDNGMNSGSVYVYVRQVGPPEQWLLARKIVPPGGAAGDAFGAAVAIDADTIAVGAPLARGTRTSGSAFIFTRSAPGSTNWNFVVKIAPADGDSGDEFGFAVSVRGDFLAVGSRLDDDFGTSSGSVYIYGRNQGGANKWGQVKKVLPLDSTGGDQFGYVVSLSGEMLAVGAPFKTQNGTNSGAAYLFARTQGGANNWGQLQKLLPSDELSGDNFGWTLSLDAQTLAVGSPRNDQLGNDSGAAYVFSRGPGGTNLWAQVRKLTPVQVLNNDQFGYAVSVSRDKVLVGMPFSGLNNQSRFGSALVYMRDQGGTNNWGLVQILERSDPENNDQFGYAVALAQNTVVVGNQLDDDRGTDSGSAYVYRLKFNNPPLLALPIPNQVAFVNTPFTYTLSPRTFADVDYGDTLALSAAAISTPAPAWLSFNPATATFSGTPGTPAIYTNRVTATDEDGASVSNVFTLIVMAGASGSPSPQQLWSSTSFGPAAVAEAGQESAVWGDNADPDEDGQSNLQEYLFGTDPLLANGKASAALSIAPDPARGGIVLSYNQRANDSRYTYVVQTSVNFREWNSCGSLVESVSRTPLDQDTERVTVRLRMNAAPCQFFRIQVSR